MDARWIIAIVTSKGQLTLPKAARDGLGLTAGSQLTLDIRDNQVTLRRAIPDENFAKWQGVLKGMLSEGETVDERLGDDLVS